MGGVVREWWEWCVRVGGVAGKSGGVVGKSGGSGKRVVGVVCKSGGSGR